MAQTTGPSKDVFTGEELRPAGMYLDGPFFFPIDYTHYMKEYGIGIPPEYEEYLKKEKGLTK